MARDDFSEKDKRVIAHRVGLQCSFPNCNAMTVGPTEDTDSYFNVGVACHIAAASPGGARYDANMTEDERKHPENGVWMCYTHSKQIDDDSTAYPTDLLKQWKREAEDRVRRRLGKATKVDTVSPDIVQLSQAAVYGSASFARTEDGREYYSAVAYDFRETNPTWYANGAFVVRFAVLKAESQRNITLFEISAVVYEYEPLPPLLPPALRAYPHVVFPYILPLSPQGDSDPHFCRVTHFCPPGQCSLVPFSPLLIDDDIPQIIDVRFTATTSGIYDFALNVVIMYGVEFQTYRVLSPMRVLFEPPPEEVS